MNPIESYPWIKFLKVTFNSKKTTQTFSLFPPLLQFRWWNFNLCSEVLHHLIQNELKWLLLQWRKNYMIIMFRNSHHFSFQPKKVKRDLRNVAIEFQSEIWMIKKVVWLNVFNFIPLISINNYLIIFSETF